MKPLSFLFRALLSMSFVTVALTSAAAGAKTGPSLGGSTSRYPGSRLAAGSAHTCFVMADGSVRCWGANGVGQLGIGSSRFGDFRDAPVPVSTARGFTSAVAVAAGSSHTCALRANGTVFCWGDNGRGQLGIANTGVNGLIRNAPVPVNTFRLNNAMALAAGGDHTCALHTDGRVFCWGSNFNGELGVGGTGVSQGVPLGEPFPVNATDLARAVALAAGNRHTCAVRADGRVFCWGSNAVGQLGNHSGAGSSDVPVSVKQLIPVQVGSGTALLPVDLTNIVALAAGSDHTCALRADGNAFCWGDNAGGSLGTGTTTPFGTPNFATAAASTPTLGNVVSLASGGPHTCALRADGRLFCWGPNNSGQLGNGRSGGSEFSNVPVVVSPATGLTNAVALAGGRIHTCALRADERLFCWGSNFSAQLGIVGIGGLQSTPALLSGLAGSISATAVATGGGHTCAVRSNGTAACWGDNSFGQVGSGTSSGVRPAPVTVRTGAGANLSNLTDVVALALGSSHTCALKADGRVFCWGINNRGQLGIGSFPSFASVATSTSIANAVDLAAGFDHTCALMADGSVACWGVNTFGQLGDGTRTDGSTPRFVSGLTNAMALAAGGSHTCALRADGRVACWGRNNLGQLGNPGTGTLSASPVVVESFSNFTKIAAGGSHTCALRAGARVFCWGNNSVGQLGNAGAGALSGTPVPAGGGLNGVIAIAAGGGHTCALLPARAACWGNNSFGQLGNASSGGFSDLPVAPTGQILTNATGVSAGGAHTCDLRVHGAVFCWGNNQFGQIGTGGSGNPRTSPVAVPSFTLNIDPLVELRDGKRRAIVHVIATCKEGDRLQVSVELRQGSARGHGHDQFECTGALERFLVEVRAQDRSIFTLGPAEADAVATIHGDRGRKGKQEWTRAVDIVSVP